MAKYSCKKSKDEILEIIVDHFEYIRDIDSTGQPQFIKDRNEGQYIARMDLLHKLRIYETESEV